MHSSRQVSLSLGEELVTWLGAHLQVASVLTLLPY